MKMKVRWNYLPETNNEPPAVAIVDDIGKHAVAIDRLATEVLWRSKDRRQGSAIIDVKPGTVLLPATAIEDGQFQELAMTKVPEWILRNEDEVTYVTGTRWWTGRRWEGHPMVIFLHVWPDGKVEALLTDHTKAYYLLCQEQEYLRGLKEYHWEGEAVGRNGFPRRLHIPMAITRHPEVADLLQDLSLEQLGWRIAEFLTRYEKVGVWGELLTLGDFEVYTEFPEGWCKVDWPDGDGEEVTAWIRHRHSVVTELVVQDGEPWVYPPPLEWRRITTPSKKGRVVDATQKGDKLLVRISGVSQQPKEISYIEWGPLTFGMKEEEESE